MRIVQRLKDCVESYPRFEFNDRNTPVNRKRASNVISIPIQGDVKRCRNRQSPAYKVDRNYRMIIPESYLDEAKTRIDWSDRHDGHPSDDKDDFKSIFNSWFQCHWSAEPRRDLYPVP